MVAPSATSSVCRASAMCTNSARVMRANADNCRSVGKTSSALDHGIVIQPRHHLDVIEKSGTDHKVLLSPFVLVAHVRVLLWQTILRVVEEPSKQQCHLPRTLR